MLRMMDDDDTVLGLDMDFNDLNFAKTFLDYFILGDE